MKRIYDFSRNPAKRNYTISDLQALKGTNGAVLDNQEWGYHGKYEKESPKQI